jgi:hypothetical protein
MVTSYSSSTIIGYQAGYSNRGSGNILIGYQAGDNITTGNRNIIIGYDIDAPSSTASYQLNIGNIIFGTNIDGIGTTISSGNIGIGTTTPTAKLHVFGSTTLGASTSTPINFVGYVNSNIIPFSDNVYSLGAPGFRWANIYAATTTVGDLVFANQFRIVETDNLATTQALIFKNQRGEEIMRLDERGNLTLAGIIEGFVEKVKQALSFLGIFIEDGIARIEKLFVREITIDFAQIEKAKINELTSKKFCLEGDDGETICLDKNQVKELIRGLNGSTTDQHGLGTDNNGSNTIHGSNGSNTDNNPQESVGTNTTSTSESNTSNPQESVSNQNEQNNSPQMDINSDTNINSSGN